MDERDDRDEDVLIEPWIDRVARAERVRSGFRSRVEALSDAEKSPPDLFGSVNPSAQVGARHHVVPRFLLESWADSAGRVQTYRRNERLVAVSNIKDLAIKDFYTVIDRSGNKDSRMESLLGVLEGDAASVIRDLMNPLAVSRSLSLAEMEKLAIFAAFQVVRTPRRRREDELMAEWYAKTLARGRITEHDLSEIEIVVHQNSSIKTMGQLAMDLVPIFLGRPMALVTLKSHLLLISDDPVVVNCPDSAQHVPDCHLSDGEIEARQRRRRRRERRNPQKGGRVIHFYKPFGGSVGVAHEIVLPISPMAAIIWGPLQEVVPCSDFEHASLGLQESHEFADRLNAVLCEQALDWIATRIEDDDFPTRDFPEQRPLVSVCDGRNAASDAINSVPARLRPRRLWNPGN